MRFREIVWSAWWLAAAALLGACAATGDTPVEASNPTGKEMMAEAEARPAETRPPLVYRFYPGDELTVNAVNRPELAVTARVDPYGYIAYPYLGQVSVKNLSPQEVAERLARGLEEGGYYTRPLLHVSLVASKEQFVYILGEVKKPGAIPLIGSLTFLDAIGKAGGQTYDAEMSTVLWIRGRLSPPGVVKINLKDLGDPRRREPQIPNLTMIPGDVLFIPDSVIVSVERFMIRMLNIIRPVVELERGIVLYPDVESVLRGEPTSARNINIIVP